MQKHLMAAHESLNDEEETFKNTIKSAITKGG
jgi:hypothetical protein